MNQDSLDKWLIPGLRQDKKTMNLFCVQKLMEKSQKNIKNQAEGLILAKFGTI